MKYRIAEIHKVNGEVFYQVQKQPFCQVAWYGVRTYANIQAARKMMEKLRGSEIAKTIIHE